MNRLSALQQEVQHGDLAVALRLVEEAASFPLAASNLHSSVMDIISAQNAGRSSRAPTAREPSLPLTWATEGYSETGFHDLLGIDQADFDKLIAGIDTSGLF